MFEAYCKDKLGPLVLRLAVGIICIGHGYLKIMSNGGTTWLPGTHVAWQLFIAWGEFGAGLAMLVGFRCRIAAGLALLLNIGTLIWVQGRQLLDQPLRSFEMSYLLIFSTLALLFLGSGGLAVDGDAGAGAKMAKKR